MISAGKSFLIRSIDKIGFRWASENGFRYGINSILFHSVVSNGESLACARNRLKRMCEWIVSKYIPITAFDYVESIRSSYPRKNAIFVSFDDAKRPILEFVDVFKEFGIPITIFSVGGWLQNPDEDDQEVMLAYIVALVEHYKGPVKSINLNNNEKLCLGTSCRSIEIDKLLCMYKEYPEIAREVWSKIETSDKDLYCSSTICSWDELKAISCENISIASHSMSHCRMAGKSALRLAFEIEGSRRLLQKHFGACDVFAYPYGTWDVVSDSTTAAVSSAGYVGAFLVAAGFGRACDPYMIPRIDIPDGPIDYSLFKSLVHGGQIPLIMLKNKITGRNQ